MVKTMPAKIYIVSGFLGAGKTTLIQKLIDEAFRNDKVAIVENDFGEANVDAALLGASGIEVTEINSGCICCNLSGDFVDALREVLDRFKPDKVIIEPSGVAKLSDVVQACLDPRIAPSAELCKKITVVDVNRCKIYLDNFGEFFENQIQCADAILLSKIGGAECKLKAAHKLVEELNKNSKIFAKPWEQITAEEILSPPHENTGHKTADEVIPEDGHCHHTHCDGDHSAEDSFDTVTLYLDRVFSEEDLKTCVSDMEKLANGTILRAKGIVRGTRGHLNLQYLPGELKIEASPAVGDMICFIGRDMDRSQLAGIFGKTTENG
jgi:G3E family GTPase